MKFRSIVLLISSFFLFLGCYDDTQLKTDITDLQQRVSTIESWCTTANGQISALQSLVQALENNDYVTGVTPLADGSGYTITFTKSKAITIKHGEKGATGDKGDKGDKGEDAVAPIIGVALDIDGNYYWTVKIGNDDPTWMVDKDGNKIRTTGDKGADGISPKVRINESTNMWEISVDGGESWVSTGVAATGATGAAGVTPQIRINAESNIWEISTDGGTTWVSTGVVATGATGIDGKDGKTPVISIALYADGNYYWKVDGEWMKVNGRMVPTTGPKGDTGATGATGPKGDAVFAAGGIDDSNRDYVVFTLANGDQIQFPKYKAIKIGKDTGNDALTIETEELTIPIKLPSGFSESDYSSIMAQMITTNTIDSDIKTKAVIEPVWEVIINKPTFVSGVCKDDASVTISPIMGMLTIGDNSMLEVTIVGADGHKTIASRVITAGAIATADATTHTVTVVTKGSLTEDLFEEALDGGNDLIINGQLSGTINPSTMTYNGEWGYLVTTINNSSNKVNLTMNDIKEIPDYLFNNCDNLKSVNLPKAVSIGHYSYYQCENLISVELPNVTFIDEYAFSECSTLATVNIPKITTILGQTFLRCGELTAIDLPEATYIGDNAFQECVKMKTVNLPKATYIGGLAFQDCFKVTSFNLPKATTIQSSAFGNCDALTTIELPMVTSLGSGAFSSCNALNFVELPKVSSIGDYAFENCANLTTLKLAKTGNVIIGYSIFDEVTTSNCDLFLGSDEPATGKVWKGITFKSITLY